MSEDEPEPSHAKGGESSKPNEEAARKPLGGRGKRGRWQEFYLKRLESLVVLKSELSSAKSGDKEYEQKLDLINRAIYSCFCDCIELEVKDEAKELLKEASGKAQ